MLGTIAHAKAENARLGLAEERELIRQAAAGDGPAMERILRQYEPLAMRAAHQPHLATVREDAESEAMLGLVEAVHAYDPSRGVPFAAYARRKVLGDVRTFFRRECRKWQQEVIPFDTEDGASFWDSVPDNSAPLRERELAQGLEEILPGLAAEERLLLRFLLEGRRTQRELARALGLSPQAVSKRKQKLAAKLRKELYGIGA